MKNIKQAFKENKVLVISISLILFLSFIALYFFSIKPSQIRKECSLITKNAGGGEYSNPEYNEELERSKQKKVENFIQCRNNNLIKGDSYIDLSNRNLTDKEWNSMSLEKANFLTLKGLSPYDAYTYTGHIMSVGDANKILIEERYKYPQCELSDFSELKSVSIDLKSDTYSYTTESSDKEYRMCLRKNGLDE